MSLDIANFFKCKNWDLSNNSEEGGESSKKQRESLNDTSISDNTEVLTERLKSPEYVSILFSSLQNLEK